MTRKQWHKGISVALVFSILLATVSATQAISLSDYRVLNESEYRKIVGGEPTTCTTLTVIYVTGAVCSAVALGWMILEATWDDSEDGNETTDQYSVATDIRQGLENTGESCMTVQEFDRVHESFLVP